MKESIRNYFEWNSALRRYFLDDSDLSVKLLCIDDDVIGIIGEQYHIGKLEERSYRESFLKSVCLSYDDRNEMIRFWRDEMQCPISCRENASLFQLAYALSNIEINAVNTDYLKLPCLALMALFILLCSDDIVPRKEVIKSLSKLTDIDCDSEGRGFDHIPDILYAISRYDNLFDNNVRGARQNVGRLQYQRVLKQKEVSLFNEFLYSNHVENDAAIFTSYEDLMNYSLLKKLVGRYSILRDRIVCRNKFVHEDFFIRQIRFFDREKYQQKPNVSLPLVRGSFYLVINSQRNSFSVFTDVRVDQEITTQFGTIPFSFEETENGYYPTNISISTIDDYGKLFYEDDKYLISTNNSGRCLFFQESRGFLFQVYDTQPGHRYYIVCQPNENKNLLESQAIVQINASVFFLKNRWSLYRVENWQTINPRAIVRSQSLIRTGSGISVPGKKDTFFANGLPEVYPDSISVLLEKDIVTRGNRSIGREIRKRNGAIYIDIRPIPELPEGISELPIKVINNAAGHHQIDSYNVLFPKKDVLENDDFQSYFSSDGWGCVCINRPTEPQLYDNQLKNICVSHIGTLCTRKGRFGQNTQDEYADRFIGLLRAFYNIKGFMLGKDIIEIANYLSGYYGIEQIDIQNKSFEYNYLIRVLVDLGLINKSYDDNSRAIYQIASPRLFPMKRMDRSAEYLLYGSYLNSQEQFLRNLTANYTYVKPYSNEDRSEHPILSFVPYYMVLTLPDSCLERVQDIGISVEDSSLSDRLLSLVKSPNLFESVFMTAENRRLGQYDRTVDYPRVTGSRLDCQLEDGTDIYNSYIPDNHQYKRAHIPYDLMRQYCQYKHNQPVFYSGEGTIGFDSGMALPSLYKKCLTYINLGLPTIQYVFSLSGLFGEKLVCRFTEYSVPTDTHSVIAEKLSGASDPKRMIRYELSKALRYELYYVKPSVYEPFIIQVIFRFSSSQLHAYARKIGDAYSVFKRENNAYCKLDYRSAREALVAVITDANDIKDHIDYNSCDATGIVAPDKNGRIIKIIK